MTCGPVDSQHSCFHLRTCSSIHWALLFVLTSSMANAPSDVQALPFYIVEAQEDA